PEAQNGAPGARAADDHPASGDTVPTAAPSASTGATTGKSDGAGGGAGASSRFTAPAEVVRQGVPTFFGSEVPRAGAVFLIDASGTMLAAPPARGASNSLAGASAGAGRGGGAGANGAGAGGAAQHESRLTRALDEFIGAARLLPDGARVTLITFGGEAGEASVRFPVPGAATSVAASGGSGEPVGRGGALDAETRGALEMSVIPFIAATGPSDLRAGLEAGEAALAGSGGAVDTMYVVTDGPLTLGDRGPLGVADWFSSRAVGGKRRFVVVEFLPAADQMKVRPEGERRARERLGGIGGAVLYRPLAAD
ncbi:MAG: hypothetical protein HY719_03700, partial [Planctomycetes bacterium]|nr:hypothetical protein [Planctomycetota bacterium]